MQQNRKPERGERRGRKKVCYFTQNHIEDRKTSCRERV